MQYVQWRPEGREPFVFEERALTRTQFKQLGVDQDDLRWTPANGWMIPRSKISAEAWPYVAGDRSFTVFDEDEANRDRVEGLEYHELQHELHEAGLPATGTADVLRSRLMRSAPPIVQTDETGEVVPEGATVAGGATGATTTGGASGGTTGGSRRASGSVGGSTGGATGSVGGSTATT